MVRGGGKGEREKEGKGGKEWEEGVGGGLEMRSNERWDSWELCIKSPKLFDHMS